MSGEVNRPEAEGISRRTALRTGAVAAGVVWTVPVLTAVGVSPAHADAASPAPQPPPTSKPTPQPSPQPTPGTTPGTTPNGGVLPETEIRGSKVPARAEELPRTGVDPLPAVTAAAALMAGGAALVAASKDRTADDAEE